jgi:DNA polymerase-3 subunit delta
MPTYLYWGDDAFRLGQAVKTLQNKVVDPSWAAFNFDKIDATSAIDAIADCIQGLNQVLTPPLGSGGRLVWLVNPPLSQQAKDFVSELERTLPALGDNSHLLLTFTHKPDGRSKTYKLLEKNSTVQEFSNIPTWKTGDLLKLIQNSAREIHLTLNHEIIDYLVEALGNDTRAIQTALQKIQLYTTKDDGKPDPSRLTLDHIQRLIPNSAQTSLDLASALREGQTGKALALLESLLLQNEPPLKVLATLIRQFRTWTWIKVMESAGERDNNAIAKAAEIKNPKRLYFLLKEIQHLNKDQLTQCLVLLRELELNLKKGYEAKASLQTKMIEISQVCQH